MSTRLPALFLGHGSPLNASEDNEFSLAWAEAGAALPRPRAILCISAHWETDGVMVTAMENPRTIHDFYGFPRPLYAARYPAPGSPELAETVRRLVPDAGVRPDHQWGLDHGTWSVLSRMYPEAEVPVVQLSLDRDRSMSSHYELGGQLAALREQGVLVVGSGNIVHNLGLADLSSGGGYDWAVAFDEAAAGWIRAGDHEPLVRYQDFGRPALLAVNSAEHYKPLLYILAMQQPGEPVRFFADRLMAGSLSMRCVQVG
jgi:4,5-DOPA dioxygenase extradiol